MSPMIKVSALYGHPADPAAFERHYHPVHMPIAAKMPNLMRYETALFLPNPDGSKPAYYRIFEAWYESAEMMQGSMASPEGQATVADLANFASGGVTILVSQVD
jgi:uncharacterized protein (TIGR02118 family)